MILFHITQTTTLLVGKCRRLIEKEKLDLCTTFARIYVQGTAPT